MNVLIAGGTGLIGRSLEEHLRSSGHAIQILTRNPKSPNHVYWDPYNELINVQEIEKTEVIINLCGSGIAEKRWTSSRKKELVNSRVKTTEFLVSISKNLEHIQQYIGASGINCYPIDSKMMTEEDAVSDSFISELVAKWEGAAKGFNGIISFVRTSVVLSREGGALEKMSKPIRMGFGAYLGRGNQPLQWVTMEDLVRWYAYTIDNRLEGPFNISANNTTNKELTDAIARTLNKQIRLPNVPSWVVKLLFGKMSTLLLEGPNVSNKKSVEAGFDYKETNLESAINNVLL